MKNTKKPSKYSIFWIIVFLFIVLGAVPFRTQAFELGQLIDPFCFFACDNNNHNNKPRNVKPTVSIYANPLSVSYSGSSTVVWNSNNATSCNASGGSSGWAGNTSTSGTFFTGSLTNSTTYTITCSNSAGSTNSSLTIFVDTQVQNPMVQLTAENSNIDFGGSTTIRWDSNNTTSCNASGGNSGWAGNKNTSGSFFTGNLTNTTTYNITCSNNIGSANSSITVFVNDNNSNNGDRPTVSIRADDTSISFGDETTIRWSSSNADFCRASGGDNGWSGSQSRSGTFDTGELTDTTTFRLTCTNENGSDNDSVTVRVDDNNNNNNNNQPDVTTRSATNVNTDSATLNGRVDGNGSSARAWFEYGTNTNFGYSTSRNSYGSGSKSYDRSISGLISNTIYYFRAVAENSEDTVYGSILSFNTGSGFINNTINNQPTVIISADSTNLAFNGATNIRWFTTDATSCFASGGSLGWAGTKNIGPSSFFTGTLTSSRTYTITCSNSFGSSTDSVTINVRGQAQVLGATITRPAPTSVVLVNSSINQNQPIMTMLDNTKPHSGDKINYTVSYQNVGTGVITDLVLQIGLPQEVDYVSSNGSNPSNIFGNTLIFNLGTLRGNGQGMVEVRVQVKDNIPTGTNLSFPATLSYIDPSGSPQSVTADSLAQIWNEPASPSSVNNNGSLGANVFGAGFLPTNLFGWLLLMILVLLLILIGKYLLGSDQYFPFRRETIATFDQPLGKKNTTTIIE